MPAAVAAAPAAGQKDTRRPFLQGTRRTWRKVAQVPVTPGLAMPTLKIPKYGWLLSLRYRIAGTVTVVAGTAGSPNLKNLISSYVLSLSGNYQYRNVDLESLIVIDNVSSPASTSNDGVINSPSYHNYDPTSATTQAVSIAWEDKIGLNKGTNADQFLLAAQARNYDITLDITFGTLASIYFNTETISAQTLVLYIEGLYFLDADYTKFLPPDASYVQQWLVDKTFNSIVVGDNVMNVVPINGPQLIGLGFRPIFNSVIDTPGYLSKVTNFRVRVNNAQDLIDINAADLAAENFEWYGRALPFGYYWFDFLDDLDDNNTVSPFWTRALATATLSSLELIVTVATGTTVTASLFTLLKRYRNPAIS